MGNLERSFKESILLISISIFKINFRVLIKFADRFFHGKIESKTSTSIASSASVLLKLVALDAYFPAGLLTRLESYHISCNTGSDNTAANTARF